MAICNMLEKKTTFPARKPRWCTRCHKWVRRVTRLQFYDVTYLTCAACGNIL